MRESIIKGRTRPDTLALLRFSSAVEAVGILCCIVVWATGGMTVHGPHGSLGWATLLIALCCIPSGTFFLLLGVAKWLGDRNRTD